MLAMQNWNRTSQIRKQSYVRYAKHRAGKHGVHPKILSMPQLGCRGVAKTPAWEPLSLILSVRAWSPLTFLLLSIHKLIKQNSHSSSLLTWKHLQSTSPHPVITPFSSSQPILPTLLPTQFLSLLPPTLPIQSSYFQTPPHLGLSSSMLRVFDSHANILKLHSWLCLKIWSPLGHFPMDYQYLLLHSFWH